MRPVVELGLFRIIRRRCRLYFDRTLVFLELQVIFVISNHWVSSCERDVFIVWSRNAGEINRGKGFDVKGMGVVIHHREVHRADSEVGGPEWHLCVNHGNFSKGWSLFSKMSLDISSSQLLSNLVCHTVRSESDFSARVPSAERDLVRLSVSPGPV